MLAPISRLRIRHRLAVVVQLDREVRDIIVRTKNKALCDLDAARVGQRKIDLFFLPIGEFDRVIRSLRPDNCVSLTSELMFASSVANRNGICTRVALLAPRSEISCSGFCSPAVEPSP